MSTKNYTRQDHQLAWEAYQEKPSFSYVSSRVGIVFVTAQRWASPEYKCPFGCPYHDYKKLIAERNEIKNRQLKLLEAGDDDPRALQEIAESIIAKNHPAGLNRKLALKDISRLVRSDIERIAHWEFIYGKVFYSLTRIRLEYKDLFDANGEPLTASDLYEQGLPITSADRAIYLLGYVQEQIDKIKNRNAPKEEQIAEDKIVTPPSIEELRQLRQAIQDTPSQQVNLLIQNLNLTTFKQVETAKLIDEESNS